MRTTVTLDPEVEALIQKAMRERGLSFKETLNSAVRAGLTVARSPRRTFKQATFPMGSEQNFRWDKALAVAEAIGDEELGRKLSLGK